MGQPSIDQRQRFLGVGTVRPDPREAMIDAAELTARLIRSFMSRGSDSFDPLPFLKVAERHATPLGAGDTLHLFVVPWPAPIEPPPGWLAIFAASTRRWKRGQAPLIQALDAFVDAFVRRRHWPLEQIAIKRYDHTEPYLFFSHQVVVMDLPSTTRRIDAA